jgi:coenzyme F420-reducing hydrogenase delta subunit
MKAFERGADGVIVSGCHPGDCHYSTGNYYTRRRFTIFRDLIDFMGVDDRRLTMSWVSASQGGKWRDVVSEAIARAREVGPFNRFSRTEGVEGQ